MDEESDQEPALCIDEDIVLLEETPLDGASCLSQHNTPNHDNHTAADHNMVTQSIDQTDDSERFVSILKNPCTTVHASNTWITLKSKKINLSISPTFKWKYQCKFCQYSSDNFSHLKRHALGKHSKIKPYACYMCDKEYTRAEKMKSHFQTSHRDDFADFTMAKTRRALDFNDFMVKRNFEQINVNQNMNSKSLLSHKVEKSCFSTSTATNTGPVKNILSVKYKCDLCEFTTNNIKVLQRHELKHCNSFSTRCYMCRWECSGHHELRMHFHSDHPGFVFDASKVIQRGDIGLLHDGIEGTDKLQLGDLSIRQHKTSRRKQARPQRTYLENIADTDETDEVLSKYSSDMEDAMVNKDIINSYPISQLKPTSVVQNDTQTNPFNDAQAVTSCTSREQNITLERTHNGPVITKRSSQVSPYKRERKAIHACEECGKMFPDKYHKERHLSEVHRKEKPFKCPSCDYATCRKHRIISHMKRHGELKCLHCDYVSIATDDFEKHLKMCGKISKIKMTIEKYQNELIL